MPIDGQVLCRGELLSEENPLPYMVIVSVNFKKAPKGNLKGKLSNDTTSEETKQGSLLQQMRDMAVHD